MVAGIGELFIFFGKMFIAMLAALIGNLIITNVSTYKLKLYSSILPTTFMLIVGGSIGILFMNVYGMSVDSIL
jgi:hypothetical protein